MSKQDKQKWDTKYLAKNQLLQPRLASQNLQKLMTNINASKALDLASGAGRNSIYLAQMGFEVDAVDIASIALDALNTEAKKQDLHSKINTHLADLDTFTIKKDYYSLIVMCNFLDRDLIQSSLDALQSGGKLFVETYMISDENEKTKSELKNLLKKDELKHLINDNFEIELYDEFKNEDYEIYKMKKQVIVARKK